MNKKPQTGTMPAGAHQSTYDAIFQHPLSRNLQWRDVRVMLMAMADTAEEHDGTLKVTRNGQTLVLHAPVRKGFSDVHELMNIRHFLETSGAASAQAADEANLLVVIDHCQARVYKTELHGSLPRHIVPDGLHDDARHLHYVGDDSNGQRKPERKSYYQAVADALRGAKTILVFGSGTGASSAMDQLIAALQLHHRELAQRVVGSIVLDQGHMSDDQLLARARQFNVSHQ